VKSANSIGSRARNRSGNDSLYQNGPITVGIDGGYVRAAHKQGWFEVIAGKSVVAFRRDDEGEVPSAKCFGFVQNLRRETATAIVGADEVPRHARQSAGGVHVGWR
jgi:hypothetical protein